MLDPQGIINQILAIFGIEGPNWLLNKKTSLLSVAMVTVWKSIGYYVLIIISALQAVPPYIYEAARLDKASRFRIFTKITIPLISPTLLFVFTMKFINSFKSFAAIDLMTQGGPQGSSMVLGYWIYNTGRVKFNYGFAMAGSIVLTVIVAVFTIVTNKFFNKILRSSKMELGNLSFNTEAYCAKHVEVTRKFVITTKLKACKIYFKSIELHCIDCNRTFLCLSFRLDGINVIASTS